MNHKTIPFTKLESSLKYTLTEFTETGKPFAVLTEVPLSSARGKFFKFGLQKPDKSLHWFFNGTATITNRREAQQVFLALLDYCTLNNTGQPFVYQIK